MAAASAAAFFGGMATEFSQGSNWDSRGMFAGLAVAGRQNQVSQAFERRFASIDYKIQRQSLHREDIRDLVDLTTSRMDIYNLVGTLLLTFCIGWFTSNPVAGSDLPPWFADLFLLNNFGAVGFLTMSVWMAMYAAIASKAVGTRLLTSFNRLAIPDHQHIEDIKIPIFFPFYKMYDFGKRMFARGKHTDSTPTKTIGTPVLSGSSTSLPSGKLTHPQTQDEDSRGFFHRFDGHGPRELANTDTLQHFRRFLHEVPRWINHDTYSRVCMSLGMNFMLQTLSYNVLGFFWKMSHMSATLCFLAVQLLSLILMKLDFVGTGGGDLSDKLAVFFLHALPPILAATALWCPLLLEHLLGYDISARPWGILSSLCYFLHAGWLCYVAKWIHTTQEAHGGFRPGQFANVLEWVDSSAVRSDRVADLELATKDLYRAIQDIMDDELSRGSIRVVDRQCKRMQQLGTTLVKAATKLTTEVHHSDVLDQIRYAEQLFDYFTAWAMAPEVFAAITALRHDEVQRRLNDLERKSIDNACKMFLQQCWDLRLGIVTSADRKSFVTLDVCHEDMYVVRVATSADASKNTRLAWVDTSNDVLYCDEPRQARIISFGDVTDSLIPNWQQCIVHTRAPKPPTTIVCETLTAEHVSKDPLCVDGGLTPGLWATVERVEVTAPPENIPYRLVLTFLLGTSFFWVSAGLYRGIIVGIHGHQFWLPLIRTKDVSALQRLHAKWPEPQSLFRIASLHCNESYFWMSSKYSSYAASHPSAGTGQLGDLSELEDGPISAILCRPAGCDALRPPDDIDGVPTFWRLQPLEAAGRESVSLVDIPRTWRLVTGAWTECSTVAATCKRASLVGWDGSAIVTATMYLDSASGTWLVRPRFELDPSVGFCVDGPLRCTYRALLGYDTYESYDDVRALQLDRGGRTLTILLGSGVFQAWDIISGDRVGRWRLGTKCASMCHTGSKLYLSELVAQGPQLVVADMPLAVLPFLYVSSEVKPQSEIERNESINEDSLELSALEGGDESDMFAAKATWLAASSRIEALLPKRQKLLEELAQLELNLSTIS